METREKRPRLSSQSGFSLVEAVVGTFIIAEVLVVALLIFETTNRLSRTQLQLTEMQQSQRASHQQAMDLVRMAGRGGLPSHEVDRRLDEGGLGVGLRTAGTDDHIGRLDNGDPDPDTPPLVEGSDVLTVRGVLSSSIFQLNYTSPDSLTLHYDTDGNPTDGVLRISSANPTVPEIPQQLGPLIEAIGDPVDDPGYPEALILVSPLTDATYAVVSLDPANSDVSDPDEVVVAFKIEGEADDPYTPKYMELSPGGAFPTGLSSVAYVGVLEEYRYYIREATPFDGPKLTRARVFPNTEFPHADDPTNWGVEIASNVLDLQVAFGIDTDGDGIVTETGDNTDEWLFNHAADDPTTTAFADGRLYYLRFSTLTRTDRRDRNYEAPAVRTLEDRDYPSVLNTRLERMYRRRFLQTVVDMRNLG